MSHFYFDVMCEMFFWEGLPEDFLDTLKIGLKKIWGGYHSSPICPEMVFLMAEQGATRLGVWKKKVLLT